MFIFYQNLQFSGKCFDIFNNILILPNTLSQHVRLFCSIIAKIHCEIKLIKAVFSET